MGLKGWEINSKVKQALTKNWIDMNKVMVNTIKDTVFIKGDLFFNGGNIDQDSVLSVANQLKKAEREIIGISGVKFLKWEIAGWTKERGKWERKDIGGAQSRPQSRPESHPQTR